MKKKEGFLLALTFVVSYLCFFIPLPNHLQQCVALLFLLIIIGLFQQFVLKRKFHSFIESLQDGVIILNWKGKILQVNRKGYDLLPKIAKKSFLFKHPIMRAYLSSFNQLKKQRMEQLIPIQLKDSSIYLRLTILKGEKKVLAILINQNEYRQKSSLHTDFIANATHEMRTPITLIKGFAETIRDCPDIATNTLQDLTEKILHNCERMSHLMRNLLILTNLETLQKKEFQKCDLVSLLAHCRQILLTLYPKVYIKLFKNHGPIIINGNPYLLELAIIHLLENGIKYSTDSPLIEIRVEHRLEKVILQITDHGIGIPEDEFENIFNRFYTINPTHAQQLGAGLGLSIIKTIISKHNGHIDIDSTIGKGTTFTLSFEKYKQNSQPKE